MAKALETIDRIQIIAEGPLELVGAGLAALTKLGYTNVGYKLITDELRFKSRKVHEVSATEFAAAFVKENARFKSSALIAHFKAAGREASAAYYGIKKLRDANVIRENGDDYVRVEALPAPKGKPKPGRGGPKQYEVPNKVLIARAIKGRKHITVRELRELFTRGEAPREIHQPDPVGDGGGEVGQTGWSRRVRRAAEKDEAETCEESRRAGTCHDDDERRGSGTWLSGHIRTATGVRDITRDRSG
jgi:hypothetical protein